MGHKPLSCEADPEQETAREHAHHLMMEVDLRTIPSAVLRRLVEEIRNEEEGVHQPGSMRYQRMHNRHNRSR